MEPVARYRSREIDRDRELSFPHHETFGWRESSAVDDDPGPMRDNALFARRVAEAARAILERLAPERP